MVQAASAGGGSRVRRAGGGHRERGEEAVQQGERKEV